MSLAQNVRAKVATLLTLTLPVIVFAADANYYRDEPRFKVQAGVTFQSLQTKAPLRSDNRTGFVVGGGVSLPLNENFAIQPEVLFAQKGSTITDGPVKVRLKYDTIEVPVFLKAGIGEGVRPFVLLGPAAFFNISNKLEIESGGTTTTLSFNPKTTEFGAEAGVGVDFGPGFVVARYQIGVTKLDSSSAEYKTRGFRILGGLTL